MHIGLGLWTTKFATTTIPNAFGNAPIWPQWMVDAGTYIAADTGTNAVFTTLWRTNTMTKFITLLNAVGAQFDSNDWLEFVSVAESSVPQFSDYSIAAAGTQFRRLLDELDEFPHTLKVQHINFFGSQDDTRELVYDVAEANQQFRPGNPANGWMVGGPDMLMFEACGGGSWGDRVVQGQGNLTSCGSWNGNYGTTDLRGKIGIQYEQQNYYSQSGPNSDTAVAYEEYDWTHTHNTHGIWRGSYNYSAALNWDTGAYPAIHAKNGRIRNPQCPAYYGGLCRTTP